MFALQASRNIASKQFEEERQAWSDLSGFLEERLGGLDDIRANGAGPYVVRRLESYQSNLTKKGVTAGRRSLWIYIMTGTIFSVGFMVAISLGAYLFLQGAVTIGTVFMFVQYTGMMGDPLIRIGQQLQQFQAAAAGLVRVREMFTFAPSVIDGPGAQWKAERTRAPSVAFDNVRFAYDDRAQVIDGVSFSLAPGKVLGLLGRTGSGKTTLTRLLFRLYDPATGTIALDGANIRDAKLTELRDRIGLVTQDVQLFEASVRDNATMFDDGISDERIREVLDDLGLTPWLSRQAHGLETILIGAGGLSAGEAQLLAFARVFLKDPGLVVLDEASSRLDPATDRLIEHAMDDLLGARPRNGKEGGAPRTAIIIAHKLDTVRRADQILILDRGKIVEAGDRAALAADPNSHFSRLLRSGIEEVLT
jgi:ABC-type multidrug transport system fused ATPase/permease subunit